MSKSLFTILAKLTLLPLLSNGLWNTVNLFENCHITFTTYQYNEIKTDPRKELQYFSTIRHAYPYSPLILNHFVVREAGIKMLTPNTALLLRSYIAKTISVIILHCDTKTFTKLIFDAPIHAHVQSFVVQHINPAFIFQHTDYPQSRLNYFLYYVHSGTSSLILFNFRLPNLVFIPSVFTESVPLKLDITRVPFPLSKIKTFFENANNNLHQKIVAAERSTVIQWHKGNNKCESRNINKNSGFSQCIILSLSHTFNFTFVPENYRTIAFYNIADDWVLDSNLLKVIERDRAYTVQSINRDIFQVIFVTRFPTTFDGIYVFLAPFEAIVWLVLLLACVVITCVVTLAHDDSVAVSFLNFVDVVSTLLGQLNGDSLKTFHSKKWVAAPLLTVWLFSGCYIIMDNLYTGSIFSFLSAVRSPVFPATLRELVDSEIPIITMGSIAYYEGERTSVLKSNHIPQCIDLYAQKPNVIKMFQRLLKKLIYLDVNNNNDKFFKFIRNVELSNRISNANESVIDTGKTFSVMDNGLDLSFLEKNFRWNGSRLIIRGNEETPFTEMQVLAMQRSFLLPMFVKQMALLTSFGLKDKWNKMHNLYGPLSLLSKTNIPNFKKHFLRAVSNAREPVTFHESDPVSLKVIKDVFVLCVMVLVVSMISITVECRFAIAYFVQNLSSRVTVVRQFIH
ncbi:hypothetical protein Fcan01_15915 [Folsomia candida]|uniref:Uncharacterized protein n=1 Tax=Folsomia candida TaxID=158441 RepID=A0A226DWT2_FOLCA|nr:hypothetical protein Fcan01_15915 [Folsomia candida]